MNVCEVVDEWMDRRYLIKYTYRSKLLNWTKRFFLVHNIRALEWRALSVLAAGLVGYTMRDIRYKWNSGLKSVGISSEVELPQFRVLGHRQRATVINLTTGNQYNHSPIIPIPYPRLCERSKDKFNITFLVQSPTISFFSFWFYFFFLLIFLWK